MTEIIDDMPDRTDTRSSGTPDGLLEELDQQRLARDIVEQARAQGVELVGPGGLLTGLTKTVLETALEAELSEHLAMTSTTRRAGTVGTPVTARVRRRC